MGKKEVKTNAMRILERMGIPYEHLEYECDEFSDGSAVADLSNGDELVIKKSRHQTLMVDLGLKSFYEMAFEKLV